MGHCYMIIMYVFIFLTLTFFLKLDQINPILTKTKTIDETIIVDEQQQQQHNQRYHSHIIKRFIRLHGHTFDQINRSTIYISKLFSFYLITNFPMNMFMIVTTFITDKNGFFGWKFFAIIFIIQQLIGFFIIHLICSIYTLKIHKCSSRLINYTVRFPLQPLSLRIRSCFYIEKIHTKNQYGIILARSHLISIIFFIKFITYV
ncbi:hypothetical protein BLA29_004817 [Euroglyphus maynei]|uniref:Uncharacterized protein n=1 Tax=Euroglyphus maynei TaxID=6958 RepID=A0A1Y3B9L9_EURMA|nr:hypothetical protein BLA29_004817 [Euroglyphus maynei]